ncbi:thermonuclease family protein [Staphylococcus sp. MI 10-1553]|nr:thermonuclease family protein [Staphylococcus sp. MI 10-1553]
MVKKHLTGKRVTLAYVRAPKERYGRTLAYVWVGDKMFNVRLAKEGLAKQNSTHQTINIVIKLNKHKRKSSTFGVERNWINCSCETEF